MTAEENTQESESEDKPCSVCKNEGAVSRTVRVGRKHRVVGEQIGWCLNCGGTGIDPN